jgi:hypothetical protein
MTTSGISIGGNDRQAAARVFLFALAVTALATLTSTEVAAQFFRSDPAPPRPPLPVPAAPGAPLDTSPRLNLMSPSDAPIPRSAPATTQPHGPSAGSGDATLAVGARYGRALPPITTGLHWRVYASRPEPNGALKLVTEQQAPTPVFALPPGAYIVNVAFGLATATKPVQLNGGRVVEIFEIPAGGLKVGGLVGGVPIPPHEVSFDVYRGSQFDPGEKRPLVRSVQSGIVVVVPEGTFHIVSNYGDANAVVRSDVRVEAGKLTDVSVTHRAAVITLKLAAERGGEALANTQWSVLTPGGDVVKESIGAFPRVVLSEGDYRVIARNEGKTFERPFKVITGVDGEIEVLAR